MKLFLWVVGALLLSMPFMAWSRMIMPPLSDNIAAPMIKQEEKPIVPEAKPKEPQSVAQLIRHYSKQYWVSEKLAMAIATCESWLNPNAKNKNSSAAGTYQHIQRYWPARAKKYWFAWASVYNAEANVAVSMWMLRDQGTNPWNASKHCWNKKLV